MPATTVMAAEVLEESWPGGRSRGGRPSWRATTWGSSGPRRGGAIPIPVPIGGSATGGTGRTHAGAAVDTTAAAGDLTSAQRPKVPTSRPRAVAAASMAWIAASGLASAPTSAVCWRAYTVNR